MDLILASANGVEECVLDYDIDMDIGDSNDFQISLSYGTWDERIQIGKLIYIPGTEYGGIIKRIESATNTGSILLKGYTWRGYLAHRIIVPPAGQDYMTVAGELNDVITGLVSIPLFRVSDANTGMTVSYRFKRYTDAASGIEAMLESVGYRLDIRYVQTESSGYVFLQAVPVFNYGDVFSQDSMIDFSSVDNQMGVNHLICLGKGELKNRLVVHLYTDADGNVSQTHTFTGIDEIVATFENSGAEIDTLIETGTKRLNEIKSSKSFAPDLKDINSELYLGDIVSGRDFITGNHVTKPIVNKIVNRTSGIMSYAYKIEGQK